MLSKDEKVHESRRTRTAKIGLFCLVLLIIALSVATAFIPAVPFEPTDVVQRHAFMEYFVAYLSVFLLVICLRRFHLQGTKDFLFWGLGFFSFAVLQVLQVFSFPGFHDFHWISTSQSTWVGYELAGSLVFSAYFLLGIINIDKRLIQPTSRNIALIYINGLALVIVLGVTFPSLRVDLFYAASGPTFLTRGLELSASGLMLVAAGLLIRRFYLHGKKLHFWFAAAAIFGIFYSLTFSLWQNPGDLYFEVGHFEKAVFLSLFLIGIFAEHLWFFKIEAELRQSLHDSKDELQRAEQTFSGLIESVIDGFVVTNQEGRITFCNVAFCNILGYRNEQLIDNPLSKILVGSQYEQADLLSQVQISDKPVKSELKLLSFDGSVKPVLMKAVPVYDSAKMFSGLQALVSDLTEQKEIERNFGKLVLEKNKNATIFKQCIENSTDGIVIISQNGSVTYFNHAFEIMSGFSKPELIKRKSQVLVYDRRGEEIHRALWKDVKTGKIWRGEFLTKKRDGSHFLGELAVIPIKDDRGTIINYLWIEKDITRRKQLEDELEQHSQQLMQKTGELASARSYYETLISGIEDILIVVDNDGSCTFLNEYGRRRLRYIPDELSRENLPVFFDDLKRLEKDYGSSLRVEIKDFECEIVTKSGDVILCSWHARPLIDQYGHRVGAMAIGRDITEFKRMQSELHAYTRNLETRVKERTRALQQKVAQLAQLLEIGEEVRLNVDIDVILNKVCEAIREVGWKRVIVSLRDYSRRTSKVVATSGLTPAQIETVTSWGDIPFEHTEKFLNETYRISNSYFIDHSANAVAPHEAFSMYTNLGDRERDEWHSLDALLVPIRSKDRILGLISVDDPADRKKPNVDTVRDLEIFADKAALAIENARLFQSQKENEKQAKFLAEIGQIFHSSLEMTEVLDAIVSKGATGIGEFCSLLLLDDKREYLTPRASYHAKERLVGLYLKGCERVPTRAGRGLIGEVVSTGKAQMLSSPFPEESADFSNTPFYFINKEYNIFSIMSVPLQVRDRIIGVMVYLTCQPRRKYQNEDLKLAQQLADRAALAIENARLFNEAEEKARELAEASRMKSEFLASVSHELRTPLNAVITLSDILMRGISGKLNHEQTKQLKIIQKSGHNLLNLINDILDLSKIEAGRAEAVYSNVPIRGVVAETIEHIRPLCIEKGLGLDFECAEDIPDSIYSDQGKLTKALINVLGNAVKFTETGGIKLTMIPEGEAFLKIQISDTGIGIPENRIDEIFKEFHQVDSSDSRSYGGTGLGLAITKKVLDLIGGSISVNSEVDKGSVFTMHIPTNLDKVASAKGLSELEVRALASVQPDFALELTDDRDDLSEDKKTILVIDDEEDALYIMRQYLHEHDYQIIFPRNGENVFELARNYQPFAIALDLIMPDQSGWDVLEILQNHPSTRDIPVFITSILQEEERALQRGATGYLVKPIEPQKLHLLLAGLESRQKKRKGSREFPRFLKGLSPKKLFGFQRKIPNALNGKPKILLVDDDLDTRYAIRFALEEAGYEVYLASEGKEAVEQVKNIQPQLILMDIMMPGMNGFEATRQLKAEKAYRNIPIIAMTAKAMKGDKERIISAGCDDYLAKPFVTEEILDMIRKWLADRLSEVV